MSVCASAGAGVVAVGRLMTRRPDPWLPGAVLLVHAAEAHALLPVVEAGLREYRRMGAVQRLDAVGDMLARWRHLAALHDDRLRGSVDGTAVSADGGDEESLEHASWITTAEAASALRCSSRWVTALAQRGELHTRRVGRVWLIDPASVLAYHDRAAG